MEAASEVVSAGNGAAAGTHAPSARDVRGPSPLVALDDEAPARLIVDPPLAERLAGGRVFIQYRTVVVVGLAPGPHRILFELADPTHRVIDSKTVHFTIPE